MIKVANLVKNYGTHQVLKEINFDIQKGEIYGFLGHNGTGKSTTMNILTGLINYNSGDVLIDGMDMKEKKEEIMSKVGYLPEDPKFYPYMNAWEYLNLIGEISGYDKRKIRKRTEELLELVKLKEASRRKVGGYSRGMRQRLGIAVSVYNHPEVLFLDEPSSALDPEGRKDVVGIIETLKDSNITVFLSTHILSDVERICDRIGILNGGKIVLEERLEELMERYILPVYDIEFEDECNDISQKILDHKWIDKVKAQGKKMSIYINDREMAKYGLMGIISDTKNPVLSYKLRKSNLEDIFLRVVNGVE